MFNPVSTYRLQFHKNFTLDDLRNLLPYFKKLGIKTIYASPITRAVPGSMHGYDGVNPQQVNPETGTTEQLEELSKALHENGIGWLQDIVPNHMAYHHHNPWLMDVMKNGKSSPYAGYFDIDWKHRVLAPFLNGTPQDAIKKGELKLVRDENGICFNYFTSLFPLKEESVHRIYKLHEEVETAIGKANDDPSFLLQLADEQHYELVHWQTTDTRINYRRFFTVNGLICLNIQDQAAFNDVHHLVEHLVKNKAFDGLRIDHIDGLYDPAAYLEQLRKLAGNDAYIVVEKILGSNEKLPASWPIQGTTGYEFLAFVNNLFTDKKSEAAFTGFYRELIKNNTTIQQQVFEKKSLILYKHMGGELDNLYHLFIDSGLIQLSEEQVTEEELKKAIAEFLIHCPVYRFYGTTFPLSQSEEQDIKAILETIKKESPALSTALSILETVLIEKPKQNNDAYNAKALHFYKRCMQFSGPLMAKGVEDTLMYSYNRFIGHNDVGDSPLESGIAVEAFHEKMRDRFETWPLALNSTSTHDTKRGEDVRARLNVLTDLPTEWFTAVKEWQQMNAALKTNNAPDDNDEYFIYQTLVGIYPISGEKDSELNERLKEYLVKALREAKAHSDWTKPNEAYEIATVDFATKVLEQKEFKKSFRKFLDKITDHGIINSLAQLTLKFTCPGVPDTYQGTELWDLSLVDPDNRRPVDYVKRQKYLQELEDTGDEPFTLLKNLWQSREDGKIKLYLLNRLLELRKTDPLLFEKGTYLPLQAAGKYKEHVIAFARRYQHRWCVVAVALHTAQFMSGKNFPAFDWKDTHLVVPAEAPEEFEIVFQAVASNASEGKIHRGTNISKIALNDIFQLMPLAVLSLNQAGNPRGAGILMPVSALPSPFHIGDIGPAAKNFVDFLSRSRQKFWQILPLTPTEEQNGYSPYSSTSGMAGNILLISPELLLRAALLDKNDLTIKQPTNGKVDYSKASAFKQQLLEKAYARFVQDKSHARQNEFNSFCKTEAYWLTDFARFQILRRQYNNQPWHQWPELHRNRNTEALVELDETNKELLDAIKWQQYIFHKQWQELKNYCTASGIKIIGDLPFYVSHNSAEVWADPDVFSLDEKGAITGVAGVPPDYFSETGQLWGMPTFRWDVLKQNKYDWWVKRLRKNLQLYDLLRIDHFRALAEYWEVPAGETTAVNGKWLKGPGTEFFDVIAEELGSLAFVAEDLGDNMEKVYALRDAVKLPGMKVLQFAFGENMPVAVDVPHNYTPGCIVYTGTHDNNTTLGWYRNELDNEGRKRLENYTGRKVSENNINETLARLGYASVANTVILPMQDLLELDESSRMNTPGSNSGNWLWQLSGNELNEGIEKKLRDLTYMYNRI